MEAQELARRQFAAWRNRYPVNTYDADHHLALVNRRYLTPERVAAVNAIGGALGAKAARLGVAVADYQSQPPRLVKFDGAGNSAEEIHFGPGYEAAGDLVWGSGLLAQARLPGNSFEQANLFYLASLEGEMGHMCAATCTTGLIRVLRRHGDESLAGSYVPGLTADHYADALRGAQFLTEVQGGSDVGAIATRAERQADGTYLITGEKWFCSVADADVFLLLARPDGAEPGTAGLGCFVVPRTADGKPNGFSIRRLKDKLGTTSMASAEIDFADAVAYPVGDVDEGFKIMVTAMLNSSRWLNAIGNVGLMRRAYLEASNYAAVRTAFGSVIGDFPLVRSQLAGMKAEWLAALHSTWELTHLDEMVDMASAGAEIDSEHSTFHRYLVNANKLGCSLAATGVIRQGIEILGGNGAIENFSVLPRLLRDAVVYEQWEGTHNVLAAQVLRDMGRFGLAGNVVNRTSTLLKGIADPDLGTTAERAQAYLEQLAGRVSRSIEDPSHGAMHFRSQLVDMLRCHQVALMLSAAEESSTPAAAELASAASLLINTNLDPGYVAADDAAFSALVDNTLGDDLADA